MTGRGGVYRGTLGPFTWNSSNVNGGTITVRITAVDGAGNKSTSGALTTVLLGCQPQQIPR